MVIEKFRECTRPCSCPVGVRPQRRRYFSVAREPAGLDPMLRARSRSRDQLSSVGKIVRGNRNRAQGRHHRDFHRRREPLDVARELPRHHQVESVQHHPDHAVGRTLDGT